MKHEESMQHIGANLRSWRAIAGLTADDLASELGISRDTVSRVERGDGSVAVGTILDMAASSGLVPAYPASFFARSTSSAGRPSSSSAARFMPRTPESSSSASAARSVAAVEMSSPAFVR